MQTLGFSQSYLNEFVTKERYEAIANRALDVQAQVIQSLD